MHNFLYIFIVIFLTACSPASQQLGMQDLVRVDFSSINDLSNLQRSKNYFRDRNRLVVREEVMRDAALSLAAQSALYTKAQEINMTLDKKQVEYDKLFDFKKLVLNDNILPPVLVEARDTVNLADGNALRLSDRSYQIVEQARFVTNPPNWRDYLYMTFIKPEMPPQGVLPASIDEHRVWEHAIHEGWEQGLQQADKIFFENMGRLKRDYSGMILYRDLLAQNIVSKPMVSTRDLGITGNGDAIAVNDRVLTITALPSLDPNGKKWVSTISN